MGPRSQAAWAAHLPALQSRSLTLESFKPEHNRHRPFESEDGSVVAVQEGEEER